MSPVQTRAHEGPSAQWPSITTETLPWTTGAVFGAMTRRDQAAQRDKYDAAITPVIAALDYAPVTGRCPFVFQPHPYRRNTPIVADVPRPFDLERIVTTVRFTHGYSNTGPHTYQFLPCSVRSIT